MSASRTLCSWCFRKPMSGDSAALRQIRRVFGSSDLQKFKASLGDQGEAFVHSFSPMARPCSQVRPAGRTEASAPTGAYRFALVRPYPQRCTARER